MVEVMAANSGGVDWSLVLKPFLSPNYERSSTSELIELCSTIVKSESEVWRPNFYNTFTVLAADYISSSISKLSGSVSGGQLEIAIAACRVLLKSLLSALQSASSEQYQDSVAIERYLNAVKVMCTGTGLLSTTEVSNLVDIMKGEDLPQQTNVSPSGNDKESVSKQESSKNRPDLSVMIYEMLTLPIHDSSVSTSMSENLGDADPTTEIKRLFLIANTESLQALRAGDTLLDLCLNLPTIKKAKARIEEALAGRPYSIPSNHAEALAHRNSLPQTVSEITLAISAINLPVLEPLSAPKLDKLCNLAMAVLHCAVAQAAASGCLAAVNVASPKAQAASLKEEDLDSNAIKLVEEALSMYSYIGVKISTRAGTHAYQNYLLAGAWVLISGLQTIQAHLTQTTSGSSNDRPSTHLSRDSRERDSERPRPSPSKQTQQGRESVPSSSGSAGSPRSGLQKFQQCFGVLSVALATKALALLSDLFENLSLEMSGGSIGSLVTIEPAPLAILGQFSALQRVARVLSAAPLNHLLFYLSIVSYRKACSLKRLIPPEGDNFSQSDSTAYFEDMILYSDDNSTDEDDDSEPILGQWFEEILVPPEPQESKSPSTSENADTKSNNQGNNGRSVVPEKGEVDGYISLATSIFVFLNKHFLRSKSIFVQRYVKNGLTEQQMIILAAIIRDLDREWLKSELGGQYVEFSNALMKFTHNLITSNSLTPLQACLLNHLGVSPWNADVPHAWPLQVYPRTLSVLAQVLLLRPQNEKEASVISIWHRLVNTLIENVLNHPEAATESDIEDLNVEHAEVLLYLFHSLNLMQKKSVVLLMAGGVLRCSEIARSSLKESQLLNLSRLLLLFDYIMKHLYDVPAFLLEKIQRNLFELIYLNSDKEPTAPKPETAWESIEDAYRKLSNELHPSPTPRFYKLSNLEVNNQDSPKLDGLACKFILGNSDKLKYHLLLDALIEIMNVAHNINATSAAKMSVLGLCATQYCFTICWRLLHLLPPSIPYMEKLAQGEPLAPGPLLMHSLVWGPRAGHKNFNRWLKDCLVKQGMYNQNIDKLLKAVSDAVNNIEYDTAVAKKCILNLMPEPAEGVITKEEMPPLWHLILLDCLVAKVEVSLGEVSEPESSPVTISEPSCVHDLVPIVIRLARSILQYTRWSMFHMCVDHSENSDKVQLRDLELLDDVLAISSKESVLLATLQREITSFLPENVELGVNEWTYSYLYSGSPMDYSNDIIPSESYLLKIIDIHMSSLSKCVPFNLGYSLKRTFDNLATFIVHHAPRIENTDTKNKAIELLIAITTDVRTEFLHSVAIKALDKMIGDTEIDERQKRVYISFLDHTYNLLMKYTSGAADQPEKRLVNEKILHSCLQFYEKIIEKSSGRQAFSSFFTGEKHLVNVLMSVSSPYMSQQYSTRVLHFFNKLFQAAEKSSTDPSLNYLCSSIGKLAEIESEKLQAWLRQIIIGPAESTAKSEVFTLKLKKQSSVGSANSKDVVITLGANEDKKSLVVENSQSLQALTSYIVKQTSNVAEDVSITILKSLIPLGSHLLEPTLEGAGFSELMDIMTMLADAGTGRGHSHLFPIAAEWVELCVKYVQNQEISEKIANSPDLLKNNVMLNAASCILDYLTDVILSITDQPPRSVSPQWEHESPLDLELDWQEETNDDDESGEDSDEDSLCSKLCTFTVTQKEFMNQHWYHCHTCRMLDGVGVCSICARVCHKGHDVSYAKYGNFFCDCGAKEDGSCQALVKRSPAANPDSFHQRKEEGSDQPVLPSSLRRQTSSPMPCDKILFEERRDHEKKKLEDSKEVLLNYLSSSSVTSSLLEFLQGLIPAIESTCNSNSPVGCHVRGVKALEQLHKAEKKYVHTDHLMMPTLGSQEGAFENVRMSYAGDQGQTIRQLLSAHIIRRVAMCCMTTTQGKRQHLAVSHEKGKITVLQLSALLKQADSASRKLTLTRLSSAPIPFTVLSMTSNLCNEEFLAVCGLKDCHVLSFNSTGAVTDHLVLHPQLETGNFIIKALWLPGSQTELALVTADFVKIFDLSKDATNPQYHFLVPSGKIRDCTFMYEDGVYHILLMSSPGHIYTEDLNDDSSTKFGSFYVTNTLEVSHVDVTDTNGHLGGGGVSIYYSHTLMLLFYSYAQGKNFISPIASKNNCLSLVFPINIPQSAAGNNSSNSKSNNTRAPNPQPLCQWTEIPNHPGIICCTMQSSNQPVVLMLKPDTVLIQEIKVVPAKSKIMDMVAIRHNSGSELRTTLILLCEDGSLKMFIANMEQTGFWMSSSIQATVPMGSSLKPKKKKPIKAGKASSAPVFPVDFFEHCTAMNDVEFGGNDLLQVYNVAQLKHRLNTTGLYIACNKSPFQVEVTNNDATMVMCGMRILAGTQDLQKVPSYVEIFGRIISFNITKSRWYDVPFSREESLQADKKLTIVFGPCHGQDSELMTMVDSIKIYGKTKDSFGWPEDSDETAVSGAVHSSNTAASAASSEVDHQPGSSQQLTKLERLAMDVFKSLDSSLYIYTSEEKFAKLKPAALKIATQLLTLPTPPSIQVHSKALMLTLHPTKQQYHAYKDQALLDHVSINLTAMTDQKDSGITDLDAESYYRLVLIVRGIAVSRPQNLMKFADSHASIHDIVLVDPLETKDKETTLKDDKTKKKNDHLLLQLVNVLWMLHRLNPDILALAPVVIPGLKYTEQVVHALVEIIHAFQSSESYGKVAITLYLQLLLCQDPVIAFSAKQALGKVLKPRIKRRKVYMPSPTRCDSPSISKSSVLPSTSASVNQSEVAPQQPSVAPPPAVGAFDVGMIEAINMLENQPEGGVNALEALLGGDVGFHPLLDLPADADETMVELAIALSLQDHEISRGRTDQALFQNLQAQLRGAAQGGQGQAAAAQAHQEASNFSDTTASAAGSDDEGSTAATDGSTLRTSPAEQGGSAGSESGGSGVESITGEHNVSGRSSAYGDDTNVPRTTETSSGIASAQAVEQSQRPSQGSDTLAQIQEDLESESESSTKLHGLRLQLLEKLVEYLPKLKNADGVRTIPFFQVVSQLTSDLDGSCERDKACLNSLLATLSEELQFNGENTQEICVRSKSGEVYLLLLKLISNILQRSKSVATSKSSSSNDPSNYVVRTSATFLHKAGIINFCLRISQSLLNDYWKNQTEEETSAGITSGNLLKPHLTYPLPDMTPFFLKNHLKENSTDVFANYEHLVTEIVLRLPYQVQRLSEVSESTSDVFDAPWYRCLSEYMMTPLPPPSRRNARKLLLYICGSKEKYRQLRDLHALSTHSKGIKQCCTKGGYQTNSDLQPALNLSYDNLVELVEHLKACLDIAVVRTGNWQRFCLHTEEILPFLLRVSFLLDEGVAPTTLQLLSSALVVNSNVPSKKPESTNKTSRKDREKSDDSAVEALFEESNCVALVEQLNQQVSKEVLARFIKTFTLENNTTTVRWQAHGLVSAIYNNSKPMEQETLLELLWQLWPLLPAYGKKARQFVDFMGYSSLTYTEQKDGEKKIDEYVRKAVAVLKAQNSMLAHHPNANLYSHMSQFVKLDGYYLESEPCLVCNNPEVPFTSIKLSSIKVDSKFTTTTQIVKLLSSHIISKITVRIGDLKKTKMVRTINIYYNNRSVQAVVELKNKPALWHKAKKVTLQSGQTEVKIEFPLPIVACNLMIEYADFYENIQASSETLQCPRCSASVPANPGVCANCGENVFQCHKCRAINYDEKDPFLCHACGFCKYAKFDLTLQAKPCCAVEPIENDEDRKKTVSSINTLLEKADRIYKQLMANKSALESLVLRVTEHRSDDKKDETNVATNNNTTAQNPVSAVPISQVKVNKSIQMLAQQYCSECKTSFEELSKIIQKVLASRKELVNYERKHHDMDLPESTSVFEDLKITAVPCVINKCYGCASAATENCLTMLRALALNKATRQTLCSYGLVQELVWCNLRKGNVRNQEEVRQLLCTVTRDNPDATEGLCNLLMSRITNCLSGNLNSTDLGLTIRHEIALLASMLEEVDDCWELKLSCMLSLFMKACEDPKSPTVMESVILPCLKILECLVKIQETPPLAASNKKAKEKSNSDKATTVPKLAPLQAPVEVRKFLSKVSEHSFSGWKSRALRPSDAIAVTAVAKETVRMQYLAEKYARKWRHRVKKLNSDSGRLALSSTSWVETVMFNPSSRQARGLACNIVEMMCNTYERKMKFITLLTCFLSKLSEAGEAAAEFLKLYQKLVQATSWKQYLTVKGLPLVLANLMTQEIEQLHRLEATTLTSDLAQGYALYQLTGLLESFLEDAAIRRHYKSKLVGAVLNGYLSLRRLVVQRTRLIDETQDKLLALLEEMTTGTEEETKAFMSVCIKTVERYSLQDILTPVFIFERLCSIIYPEENDVGEFFLTLEKDPQQEDFLQGRMLGNPYSSNEVGLGPLMRDVKNKICQDCELVALLEDDNGMELLVNNKIMSLDLPVKDVYVKVWVQEGGDHDAMRVVYRMRGLLGDATEEFIETLDNKEQSTVDNEEVYKMANVLADCGGLKVMVTRLGAIQNARRAKPLLQVLLKLFTLSVKVNRCQEVLIEPELGAIEAFLRVLQLCLKGEPDSSQSALIEQVLDIMETLMSKATTEPLDVFEALSQTFGGPEYVKALLSFTVHPSVKNNTAVLTHLTRVLAALVYGDQVKMGMVLHHFSDSVLFDRYDALHNMDNQQKFESQQQKMEMFCMLTNSIERNAIGNTLKDYILKFDIVKNALKYIARHAPCVKPTLLRTDSDELKRFISKPALKYILRILTGLAHSHENTQLELAKAETISIIHRLEQVSSDEHVGSLAENLLEALCTNPAVAKQIEEVREFTRSEKKRLAMAMREKQLGQLGMCTNDKGQVTAKSTILQQIEELGEESGLVCCICREGYKYQPTKVLGIYTFTKRCNVEKFEYAPRQTVGYSTVTHFNVVHIDCHMSAVRLARARDEWESAALQNANTKCNGLLPLWGPQVPESAFASCLARHNTYLQESTNHRDIGHASTVHDLKLLLLRFAQVKTFHEDTGGGGPQSNMHLVPYLIHVGLYVINTTRVYFREYGSLTLYKGTDIKVDLAYQVEGPLYMATLALFLKSKREWEKERLEHLSRLIVIAHVRSFQPRRLDSGLGDKSIKDYYVYRPYLIFFGLIDAIYTYFFKDVEGEYDQWPTNLADYIRHNDEALMKNSDKLLAFYTGDLLPCASFAEFCDVLDLYDVNPDTYITSVLDSVK
ncbi:E3 ubiquitin-protein ligase UBR4 isoform X2 [Euwallacea fornicatus]|uniref:E3 ubiquitin-protein ligase UBR4 isoform X2 n=1 Tax=Euwallacea fornicatus TaxID=995702 RepID=UPI00338F1BCE